MTKLIIINIFPPLSALWSIFHVLFQHGRIDKRQSFCFSIHWVVEVVSWYFGFWATAPVGARLCSASCGCSSQEPLPHEGVLSVSYIVGKADLISLGLRPSVLPDGLQITEGLKSMHVIFNHTVQMSQINYICWLSFCKFFVLFDI